VAVGGESDGMEGSPMVEGNPMDGGPRVAAFGILVRRRGVFDHDMTTSRRLPNFYFDDPPIQ